jgi:hypothetical protein
VLYSACSSTKDISFRSVMSFPSALGHVARYVTPFCCNNRRPTTGPMRKLAAEYRVRCRNEARLISFWPIFGRHCRFLLGALQTVNLLALRLQWFESTPTQASPRAILQVMAQLAPAGINIIIKPQNQTRLPAACSTVQHFSSVAVLAARSYPVLNQ